MSDLALNARRSTTWTFPTTGARDAVAAFLDGKDHPIIDGYRNRGGDTVSAKPRGARVSLRTRRAVVGSCG